MSYLPIGANRSRDPIMDPPTVAGPDDDEFTSFSANWSLYTDTAPITTAYTNVGPIDLSLPGQVAANTFRASVIGSTLWLQIPLNTNVLMVKNVAAAITQRRLWWTAFSVAGDLGGTTNNPRVRFQFMKQVVGKPDTTNNLYASVFSDSCAFNARIAGVNQTTKQTATVAGLQHWIDGLGMVISHNLGGTSGAASSSAFLWRRNGSYAGIGFQNNVAFNAATDYVGFHLCNNTAQSMEPAPAGPTQNAIGLHFLRSVPWPGWIANP